jgi:hypothetical protein
MTTTTIVCDRCRAEVTTGWSRLSVEGGASQGWPEQPGRADHQRGSSRPRRCCGIASGDVEVVTSTHCRALQ